jgi:hypothetical protein
LNTRDRKSPADLLGQGATVSKDDKFGLAGVIFCSVLAWFDEQWRPFWAAGAVVMGVWTAISVMQRGRR